MNNEYFDNKEKKYCNGCGLCAQICPQKAIKMIEDAEGFVYPQIDDKKCINCGLCKKKCPNVKQEINNYTKCYILKNKSNEILSNSSSGGAFFSIASKIIEKNGIVFGVKFNEKLIAVHDYVDNVNSLKLFQGSKYVRSNSYNCYDDIIYQLKNDRTVLFTGTPCQCAAVRKLTEKYKDKIYTCEIICHANPSPSVFEMYKKNLEYIYKKKLVNIEFRSKKNGWKNQTPIVYFEDGSCEEENSYFYAFVRELINRQSCYNCNFCTSNRLSDFTIGDVWGIEKISTNLKDDDTGLSLVCVNSEKGMKLFDEIRKDFILEEVDKELAFSFNHNSNIDCNKKRDLFFQLIERKVINEQNIIEYFHKYTKLSLIYRIKRKLKELLNRFH